MPQLGEHWLSDLYDIHRQDSEDDEDAASDYGHFEDLLNGNSY